MNQAGWKSPDAVWPDHSRSEARNALTRARQAGWWLKKSSGQAKVWGAITCGDPALPKEQRCSTIVMSTSGSADGSATARALDTVLRKCPHTRADAGADLLDQAEALVACAAKCLETVRALIEARGHRELMEDFLRQALDQSDQADELLAQATKAEELAEVAVGVGEHARAEAGVPADAEPVDLTRYAEERAASAKRLVADATDRAARLLRARCDAIRAEARSLRSEW